MGYSLIRGDAATVPLADGTVALVVTSPPYWALRFYRDDGEAYEGQIGSEESPAGFLVNLWNVMDELWRTLRDDGSVWVNLGDKWAGSGGHNNNGLGASTPNHGRGGGRYEAGVNTGPQATRRQAPDRYLQDTGGLRNKSRMLLPHRFALGCEDPEYRRFEEARAGLGHVESVHPQWIVRMDAVWSKPNGMPESATDRVRGSHEYLFHLTKSERYFSAIDNIREEHVATATGRNTTRWRPGPAYPNRGLNVGVRRPDGTPVGEFALSEGGRLPGSVWDMATEPLILPPGLPEHFAAFPVEIPKRIILGWSPSGICTKCGEGRRLVTENIGDNRGQRGYSPSDDRHWGRTQRSGPGTGALTQDKRIIGEECACPTIEARTRPAIILDPFSGTGTTAIVADALGRHGVGIDLSADYHTIARWRDRDGALRAKALEVARPPKQADGQMSLLDL